MAEEKIVPKAAIGSSAENAYKGPETDRRGFISWLSFGWLAYLGVTGGFFTMIVRFLFPNVLFEPPQSFKIGYPDDFAVGLVFKKPLPVRAPSAFTAKKISPGLLFLDFSEYVKIAISALA